MSYLAADSADIQAGAAKTKSARAGAMLPATVQVDELQAPPRWHDPLRLIEVEAPSRKARVVLWSVLLLCSLLLAWATVARLDIIVTAEGRLVPQTLVKIVQPAEAGILRELLVQEGDMVRAGQVLARLDSTLANAETAGTSNELMSQRLQQRRLEAELQNRTMQPQAGDDPLRFRQVQQQAEAHRTAFTETMGQERAQLQRVEQEMHSAAALVSKLELTVPTYRNAADAFAGLGKDGYVPALQAADRQREATEKEKDLVAQRATLAAAQAAIQAQQGRMRQLQSQYRSDLEHELADVRSRILQLLPAADKNQYREGVLTLRAPQDGVVKDLSTTTVGAVVQPGAVLVTLVPRGEALYADVTLNNQDVAFVQPGQAVRIKLAAYPFQRYGMLDGRLLSLSPDAQESAPGRGANDSASASASASASTAGGYKARILLQQQALRGPDGALLPLTAGMRVTAELNQGRRTVLEYLLSPVQKTLQEAGRER